MNTPTEAVKFNISYIKSCVRSIKNDVTKNCKKQGFYPLFESDYVVGISPDGHFIRAGLVRTKRAKTMFKHGNLNANPQHDVKLE